MRALLVSMFVIALAVSLTGFAFADAGHGTEEAHGDTMMTEEHNMMTQTTDRSGQLLAALMGAVIGLIIGVVAVKFFFTKGA